MTSKSSKGFTLIELLVVVAVLGIISVVGTVAYQGYIGGARQSAASSIIQQISLAQLEYFSNTGSYYISGGAGGTTTECTANDNSSAEIEDMLFGDADGATNLDSPGDDPDQLPGDIDFAFCIYGDPGSTYTVDAQQTTGDEPRCVIRLSKNGGIEKVNCWNAKIF